MALKSWTNTGEVVYGNDLNGNFNGLAAGTEISNDAILARHMGSSSVEAASFSAEAWSTGTPAATGFSSKTTDALRYIQYGKTVFCEFNIQGTSNATTLTFSLPVAAKSNIERAGFTGLDNNSRSGVTPRIDLAASSTTASCYKAADGSAWTNTSTKMIQGFLVYEAA